MSHRPHRGRLPEGPGPLLPFAAPEPPRVRRFLVLHFPDLACELAIFERESRVGVARALTLDSPAAAVLLDEGQELLPTMPLHGASLQAGRAGVRPGQTAAEARRLLPGLDVRGVLRSSMVGALRCFADAVRDGSARQRLIAPDSLSLGLAGEGGDEAPLVLRLCERLRLLGHRVRAAVADHEAAALLLARYGPDPRCVVAPGRDAEALAPFPPETLRRAEAALSCHPPAEHQLSQPLVEEVRWAEPAPGVEPLQHAAHWLAARASARLGGRRQEATQLRLTRLGPGGEAQSVALTLARPTGRGVELIQAMRPSLAALAGAGPAAALSIDLGGLRAADEIPASGGGGAPLQALAADLGAELGPGRVGMLSSGDGALLPRLDEPPTPQASLWPADALMPPTRVLDVPVAVLGKLARGARVEIDHLTFVVQRVTPVAPGGAQPSHEHLVVWLSHGDSGALSWIVRDRRLKRALLHGWFT